jgi:arsenate reductase-like glutaredoxin family protein
VSTAEEVNARQTSLGADDALALARSVDQIFATRGNGVVHVDLRGKQTDDAALKKLLLGPTGKLRAPTLRVGKTLLVGFHRDTYANVLG